MHRWKVYIHRVDNHREVSRFEVEIPSPKDALSYINFEFDRNEYFVIAVQQWY